MLALFSAESYKTGVLIIPPTLAGGEKVKVTPVVAPTVIEPREYVSVELPTMSKTELTKVCPAKKFPDMLPRTGENWVLG